MHDALDQILGYLKASWRHRWYGLALAWVAAIGGWIAVTLMPNRYEASARVYVDTQSVLRPLLTGVTVLPNSDQLISMMSRTLISRPNVEKVIRMADLEIKLKTPQDRENFITRLTKELAIQSTGRENLYKIVYSDKNPQEAKRVVQSLLTIFVEGSLGDKRKDGETARRFIEEQVKAYAEKLKVAEDSVTDFKRRNMGLMGNEAKNYYLRMAESKAALNQATLELREAENSRDAIKKQLAGDAPPDLLKEKSALMEKDLSEPVNPELDARILSLQQKLDGLRLTYTERHPDIIAMLRMIDQLKDQKKSETEKKLSEAKAKKPAPASPTQTQNPVFQQLSVSLAQAEAVVAAMKARVAEYDRRYKELGAAANAVPQVEAEYTQLTRDYEVTKANYEKLLSRREQAQISGDMEANTNVMDFRVIDPPQVPTAPNAPNRPMLMTMVLFAALGAGIGFAFVLSQLKPSVYGERRLRDLSGLPVFGSVVMVHSDAQKSKRKKGLIALVASFLALLSTYGAIMAALMMMAAKA